MISIWFSWVVRPVLVMVGAIALIGYFTGHDVNILLDGIAQSLSLTFRSVMQIAKGGA